MLFLFLRTILKVVPHVLIYTLLQKREINIPLESVYVHFRGNQLEYGDFAREFDIHAPPTFMELDSMVDTYGAVYTRNEQLVNTGSYVKITSENVSFIVIIKVRFFNEIFKKSEKF